MEADRVEPDRWDRLADSLWDDTDEGLDDGLVRAVAEAETAQVSLVHRLRVSGHVVVHTQGPVITGTVAQVGPAAVILISHDAHWLAVLSHVVAMEELAPALASEPSRAADRVGLASMLRAWVGRESHLHLAGGRVLRGVICSVGLDHVDLLDEATTQTISVTFPAIVGVRVGRL